MNKYIVAAIFLLAVFNSSMANAGKTLTDKLEDKYFSVLDGWVERGGKVNEYQSIVLETCGKLVMVEANASEAVAAHELYSAHTPTQAEWQRTDWDAAVDGFTAGDWANAYDRLDSLFSSDPAAQCLMRAMDRTHRELPANWDGSFVPEPPPDAPG